MQQLPVVLCLKMQRLPSIQNTTPFSIISIAVESAVLRFLPKSEENIVLPIGNLQKSTRQGSSDAELHCTGVVITLTLKDQADSLVHNVRIIHDAHAGS